MEDIAFNEWPGQPVDLGSGNAWLPAYGFQTPAALLDRDDFLGNPDAEYFLQGNPTPCLYLETIHEETSDDLRSDSDISDVRASPLGWLATDSETDSVICMDATNDTDCESDREIACPVKRRRQENLLVLPPEDEYHEYQSLSRSSSLLQFETLEKQCQETSSSSPSIYSQFSLDSLEHKKSSLSGAGGGGIIDLKASSTSGNGGGDGSSDDSETTLVPSRGGGTLKTWHSFDSLPAPKPTPTRDKISAENLSEDSGYSDHTYHHHHHQHHHQQQKTSKPKRKLSAFNAYDYCEAFQRMSGNFGASRQNLSAVDVDEWRTTTTTPLGDVNLEKTSPSECRTSKYNNSTSASEPNLLWRRDHSGGVRASVYISVPKNLDLLGREDEDGIVKTSIAAKNWDLGDFTEEEIMAAATSYKREGSYAEAMTNRVDLSDDEHGLCYNKKKHQQKNLPRTTIVEFDKKVLHAISESIHSLNSGSIADNYLSNIYSTPSPRPSTAISTPNLVMSEQDRLMTVLLSEEQRRRSVQDIPRKSSLSTTTTTSDLDQEQTMKNSESASTSMRGVHFSPVVSEVNWPEDSSPSTPSTVERESTYSLSSSPERDSLDTLTKSLLMDGRFPTPPRQPSSRGFTSSQPELNRRPQHQPPPASFQSQPDVSGGGGGHHRRRGSQLIKKDSDGCIIKAYVDGDGVHYKHTHLDVEVRNVESAVTAPSPAGHVAAASVQVKRADAVAGMEAADVPRKEEKAAAPAVAHHHHHKTKLGGFFSRLTSFRFSARKNDEKAKAKKKQGDKKTDALVQTQQKIATKDDYIYIPLKGPLPSESPSSHHQSVTATSTPQQQQQPPQSPPQPPPPTSVSSKPPLPRLPPRVVGASVKRGESAQGRHGSTDQDHQRRRRTIDSGEPCPRPMEPMGLIETDLDTEVTVITSGTNVKTRSLLNLGAEPRLGGLLNAGDHASASDGRRDHHGDGAHHHHSKLPTARPHKSMEFLLDKQNLKVVEPPENELQKGERVMSEHQLRVQRSLQKLTVPEWYKQSQVPREGFLLKKNRESRWTGTGSKTTSLSSLGSSPIALSPASQQPFVRWSTSKLNSTASSPCASTRSSFARQPNGGGGGGSVSPSSTRSSFSYRQPYLGWRSQERLHKPRTPAERLANSLLQQQEQESPEIQTSIKEVTSAIVHYVSGLKPDEEDRSRSVSPRGSQKLCWLESSFVGIRPLDSPQTPVTLTESHTPTPPTSLRLDLQTHNATASANTSPNRQGEVHFRRRSEGSEPTPTSRRVSFQSSPVLQCRYSRCAKIVAATSPEAANFKNCHNCSYTYCSRACRRAHWEKHRKTCLFSRIGTLCRQVIAAVKEQKDSLYHLSLIARRGYLSHGPGAVKCFFPCPEAAERFLTGGLGHLGELTYVRWPDLLPSEMGPQLYSELVQMCKSYNPDSKLVLYVSVCVVSETPATGAVKWERQLVSRCAKMRLSKDLEVKEQQDNPETLILTCTSIEDKAKAKELKEMTVNNVQKQLRQRGVSLRRQHPVIFKQLCAYANGSTEKFTPITVYPKDSTTGKSFMCIIMLEADPDSLRQVESAAVKVRTVDVLCAD